MSLDVYLIEDEPQTIEASSGIFVRENGQTKEITRAEWDAKNPNREPVIMKQEAQESTEVFEANVTHNLGAMASEAGIYKHIWRPEELDIRLAGYLIEPLEKGLADMKSRPEHYKKFNPENGWGSYKDFVPWIENYLEACKEYPLAKIGISR